MNKKSLFLYIFFIINLSILVNALSTDDVKIAYTFDISDKNSTYVYDLKGYQENGSIIGSINTSGKIGAGQFFDGNGDVIVSPTIRTAQSWSINFWSKYTDYSNTTKMHYAGIEDDGFIQLYRSTGEIFAYYFTTSENVRIADFTDNNWHMITFVYDAVNDVMQIYKDGTLANSSTMTDAYVTAGTKFTIGNENRYGSYPYQSFNGAIDEPTLWLDYVLNSSEVSDLYDSGSGNQYPFGDLPPPDFNIVFFDGSPNNGTFYANNTIPAEITFNYSISNIPDGQNVTCDIYQNSTLYESNFIEYSVANMTQTFNITFNERINSTPYTYSVNCTLSNGTEATDTEKMIYVLVDDIDPLIVFYNPDETIFTTQKYHTSFILNMSVFDSNNYYGWVDINSSNGTRIFYKEYNTTGYPVYNITELINHTFEGSYTITGTFSDGHTAEIIKNISNNVVNKEIEFRDKSNIIIKPENKQTWDNLHINKEFDRYTFDFVRSAHFDISDYKYDEFTIESDYFIDIVKSAYKGHIIIREGNQHEWKWVDFETEEGYKVDVIRHNNTKVNIRVYGDPKADYHFKSFGILNTNTENISYVYYTNNIVYSNYTEYNLENYTRTLVYNANLTCLSIPTYLDIYINSIFNQSIPFDCVLNSPNQQTGIIYYGVNEPYNLSIFVNSSTPTFFNIGENTSWISDISNPVIRELNFSFDNEGFNFTNASINLRCTDDTFPNITYNITFNGNSIYYRNELNNTNITNSTNNIVSGENILTGVCSDPFGSTSQNIRSSIYLATLLLIDEVDNTLFDVESISGVRVYFDDNHTYYDFKDNNVSSINFTAYDPKLRFELKYSDNTIITRYIDISLINETELRVCANEPNVTHYEQVAISSQEIPIYLLSVFSDCYIGLDYTRFAYEDSLSLKSYSIDTRYYLSTYNNSNLLASIDGSIASFINIDVLEFNKEGYDFSVLRETLSTQKYYNNTIKVYYKNLDDSNDYVNLIIYNMDSDEVVYNSSSFSNPNEFTTYFNYGGLSNVSNSTLFKAVLLKYDDEDVETSMQRYFNIIGGNGLLPNGFAIGFAILLILGGMTLVATSTAFSWMGIFLDLFALGLLSLSTGGWTIIFMEGIICILLVYTIIVMFTKNTRTIA